MKRNWNKLFFFEKPFLYGRNYLKRIPYYFNRLTKKNLEVSNGKIKLKFVNIGPKSFFRVKTIFTKEPITIDWINKFKKNDIFWDVGANVGIYTIYAVIKSKVHAYAFEPMPLNYKSLCLNISLNKVNDKITPFCLALNDKNMFSYLYIKWLEEGYAGTSFNTPLEISSKNGLKIRQFCTNIDTLVYKLGMRCPNYLKIDVDGNDLLILKGAQKVMKNKKFKSLFIEIFNRGFSLEKKKKMEKPIINYLRNYNLYLSKNEKNNYIFTKK